MMKWPEHYPELCPPEYAEFVSGTLYRFVARNPSPQDFLSFYEIKPEKDWGDMSCQARGLSVFRAKEHCEYMASIVPAMKKKRIAAASLKESDGVIAGTPSNHSAYHHTLWPLKSAAELAQFFALEIAQGGSNA